ncbi:MAG: hypothetical protein M1828_000658 [Chrysothrix sp. TS-e1954]|nr:MAG: hypothetical protein M1828_000658 [Chrysothrix sp. TS-e1954]
MQRDPREKPPEESRHIFKRYQKLTRQAVEDDLSIVDLRFGASNTSSQSLRIGSSLDHEDWVNALRAYVCSQIDDEPVHESSKSPGLAIDGMTPMKYHHVDFPGLVIIPKLLPLNLQATMLSRMLHRDLANDAHKTNVHFHHHLSYPAQGKSFFDYSPESTDRMKPKDVATHTTLSISQFLSKKLRWMTLGGQYDWTKKQYPSEEPPAFPSDHLQLFKALFPDTDSQAAIINLYSPGDTLSLHRDVSEQCDRGLISISIGCDGLFMLALAGNTTSDKALKHTVIRLRSGDAVYMTGPSRYAWHGVPMVIPNTCPRELEHWPAKDPRGSPDCADDRRFSQWRDWMASKRININVRQMRDESEDLTLRF